MKYKVKQHCAIIEPVLYTRPYLDYGDEIQVLENIKSVEKKEIIFESNIQYQIGEQVRVDNDIFTIENIIKPTNNLDCIELIVEDKTTYCEDYHKEAEQMIEIFKLTNPRNEDTEPKLNLFGKLARWIEK